MEQINEKWFKANRARLKEVSKEEVQAALKGLREYVIMKLKGQTLYGAHSVSNLTEDAVGHYVQSAWQKLCEGVWEWKQGRTLTGQLCRIASSMMQMEVKKYLRAEKRGEVPVMMYEGGSQMADVEDRTAEVRERKEEGYRLIMEALKKCKPELRAYVEAAFDGAGNYEDIAEKMGLETHEVVLLERRVMYKIKKYRDEQAL